MTGRQVRTIRVLLDLDPFTLAYALGVHVSSLYRWEATRVGPARIDRCQAAILLAVEGRIADATGPEVKRFRDTLLRSIHAGDGAVRALWLLVGFALGEFQQKQRPRGR